MKTSPIHKRFPLLFFIFLSFLAYFGSDRINNRSFFLETPSLFSGSGSEIAASINLTEKLLVDNQLLLKKKIAFLFLIKTSLPLAPFWAKFFKNHEHLYSIYINSKRGYSVNLSEPFKSANQFSHNTSWGDFSIMEAEILLLSSALMDKSNHRFILVSDSCIPLYNFEYFYHYLMNSSLSFTEVVTNFSLVNLNRYSTDFMPEVHRRKWSKGSQWFEMTHEVATRIISDKVYYPKFKQLCPSKNRPTCVPDEHYIQTFLRNTVHYLSANRSLTWTNWTGCHSCKHPRSYDSVTEAMVDAIKAEKCEWNDIPDYPCHLIARKFTYKALPSLLNL